MDASSASVYDGTVPCETQRKGTTSLAPDTNGSAAQSRRGMHELTNGKDV